MPFVPVVVGNEKQLVEAAAVESLGLGQNFQYFPPRWRRSIMNVFSHHPRRATSKNIVWTLPHPHVQPQELHAHELHEQELHAQEVHKNYRVCTLREEDSTWVEVIKINLVGHVEEIGLSCET